MNDNEAKHLIERARYEQEWRLYDDAEQTLRLVMESDSPLKDAAQIELISAFLAQNRFEEIIGLGADLAARGVFRFWPIIQTSLALFHTGKIKESREQLALVEKCGHSLLEEGYQMACCATQLGEYSEAFHWLCFDLASSNAYHTQAFSDMDLAGLWPWLKTHKLTRKEAHILLDLPIDAIFATTLTNVGDIQLSPNDLKNMPKRLQRLFRHNSANGYFTVSPATAAKNPKAVQSLMKARTKQFEMVQETLLAARDRASRMVNPSGAEMAPRPYKVIIDDNMHFMDESARYEEGGYYSALVAVGTCRGMVSQYLRSAWKPGMTAKNLIMSYRNFGEDPWVAGLPLTEEFLNPEDGKAPCHVEILLAEQLASSKPMSGWFSAWNYAEQRAAEICDQKESSTKQAEGSTDEVPCVSHLRSPDA